MHKAFKFGHGRSSKCKNQWGSFLLIKQGQLSLCLCFADQCLCVKSLNSICSSHKVSLQKTRTKQLDSNGIILHYITFEAVLGE